jgi:thioredoxin 1
MKDFNEQIAGDTPVLVEFFATWCPHCQRMMPRMEELKRRMGGKLKVVQLDIDAPANARAVHYFNIYATPTFILFRRGMQLWRGSGEYDTDRLIVTIENYI